MINNVRVSLIEAPDEDYSRITRAAVELGVVLGEKRYGADKFKGKRFPSEEKLRVVRASSNEDILQIDVVPFQWSDLVAYRELMPSGATGYEAQNALLRNALALTANAVLRTIDNRLLFHMKKGGASEGSVHTFGGYVSRADLTQADPIAAALVRELMEKSELGLSFNDFLTIGPYLGERGNLPAALWDFGTAAVYGVVNITRTSQEIAAQAGEETLEGKTYSIHTGEVKGLEKVNIHPQTAKVIPSLIEVFRS